MQNFYPAIKTYADHNLKVDDYHTLYIEEAGNPMGIPVLVMHSGPGAGCDPFQRRFFDPEVFRIVLFDQRGAGRSTPHAELRNNNTPNLVEDIETIRKHLKVDQWIVFGGAWGSTLSLLYAQAYPQNVRAMVLHSIFLARQTDIDWFYQQGANCFFPDYWQDFIHGFSAEEQKNLVASYHQRLNGADEIARMATAKSWSQWQARCATLQPHMNIIDHFADPRFAVGLACIETHYFTHQCFIEENQILNNMDRIQDIPTSIIHGRYNMVCPMQSAWDLHQTIPKSELFILRDAGHSSREPGIIDALILATRKIARPDSTIA